VSICSKEKVLLWGGGAFFPLLAWIFPLVLLIKASFRITFLGMEKGPLLFSGDREKNFWEIEIKWSIKKEFFPT
jgi:hypothetical protein